MQKITCEQKVGSSDCEITDNCVIVIRFHRGSQVNLKIFERYSDKIRMTLLLMILFFDMDRDEDSDDTSDSS